MPEGQHPGAMKDAVCSPKGTTIKGVAALEKNGFRHAIIEAIDAADKGDFSVMIKLLEILSKPYEYLEEAEEYTKVSKTLGCYKTYCGT